MPTGDGSTESMDIRTATLEMSGIRNSALMTRHAPRIVPSMEFQNKIGITLMVLRLMEIALI